MCDLKLKELDALFMVCHSASYLEEIVCKKNVC